MAVPAVSRALPALRSRSSPTLLLPPLVAAILVLAVLFAVTSSAVGDARTGLRVIGHGSGPQAASTADLYFALTDMDARVADVLLMSRELTLGIGRMPIPIEGVGQAWHLADAGRRRALLGVCFEKLYVADGAVTKYVARREYAQEVEALMELAVGDGLEFDVPLTGPGRGLKRALYASRLSVLGGKGGVLLRVSQKFEVAPG